MGVWGAGSRLGIFRGCKKKKKGRNRDGHSSGSCCSQAPWGLHMCLLQAAHGPRGLKGEKGEPAVLEPVSCTGYRAEGNWEGRKMERLSSNL